VRANPEDAYNYQELFAGLMPQAAGEQNS